MTAPFRRQALENRALIRLSGENVLGFLHNLITADVERLAMTDVAYGGLLSAQGKIQHEMFVHNRGDSVVIDCVREQRDDLIRKLLLYRLRARITIEADDGHSVVVDPSQGPVDGDPRLRALGSRHEMLRVASEDRRDYREYCLSLGIADGEDIGVNEHFPHEANFDLLNAVSFTKGCYVGQEVVSRMQHRGTARNRMLPISVEATPPPKGSPITSGDIQVGSMLSSSGDRAMALIRLDRLAEVSEPLLSQGVRLHVHKPDWMAIDFTIPEAAR